MQRAKAVTKKKTAKKLVFKRPARRYALIGLWFGALATLVLVLGAVIFLVVLEIVRAISGSGSTLSANSAIIATGISAIILVFAIYLAANLLKRKSHTLARWSRKSLNILAILTLLPLFVTLSTIVPGDNNKSPNSNELPTWAQYTASPEDKTETELKRYQYMLCSNSTYRYYTDEQFKDPNTGFTSKSPDNCAESNQGKMTQLADAPPKEKSSYTPVPAYIPSECTKVTIPHKTTYVNDPLYPVGYKYEGYGSDGYKYVCTRGSGGHMSALNGFTVQPYDKTVRVGIGNGAATVPTSRQDPVARQKCISDYNSARAQLQMHGAAHSSAMDYLNQLHSQCLARAGY